MHACLLKRRRPNSIAFWLCKTMNNKELRLRQSADVIAHCPLVLNFAHSKASPTTATYVCCSIFLNAFYKVRYFFQIHISCIWKLVATIALTYCAIITAINFFSDTICHSCPRTLPRLIRRQWLRPSWVIRPKAVPQQPVPIFALALSHRLMRSVLFHHLWA